MTYIRQDIAFAIGKLSRFTSSPDPHHCMVIRRVLRYLLHTKDYGIAYSGEPLILEGYSDASWITNEENDSSTSGWVFIYGGGVFSWSSKKQTCIADSTMSAEFIDLASASSEA
ncbi:secreted RxLR effector protein 161-like [Amaranthus tricolor]|uniref:secreted RxLR effector protein 161-like n=1 Tax=Amaranthus tricolor TaxID=29722 RepID=UPI0025834CDA|nr:secreted RxLR effector protein 161-like [Amaranthus tricolor]